MEDQISGLADDVLVHILSFLTFKEAVRSALLSSRWRMLNPCLKCSNLDFRDIFFDRCGYATTSTIRKRNKRSLNVVDKIILGRNRVVIQKFSVTFSWRDIGLKMSSIQWRLDRWINCLAKPGLAVLDLKVCYIHHPDYFSFPLAMLASETTSLHVLSLDGFQLSSPVGALSSLRSLSLNRVSFDDGVLEKICPLLENLQLSECVGLKTLNLRGSLDLKKLQVYRCRGLRKIDMDAPTLEGLQLSMDMFFHQFLTMCPLLEELKIGDICPTLPTFHFSTILYALKTLHLTRLVNMVKFAIIAPNLEIFDIGIYTNIPIITLDASDKMEVTVHFNLYDYPHDQVAEFLGTFNPCKSTKLYLHGHEGFLIAKQMRTNLPSPLYGTKCLEFHMNRLTRRLSEYLDYMLWLSPQATNLMITAGSSDHCTTEIVLECEYEKIGIGSEVGDLCPCCKLIPITCWRHCLKEVRIQEFSGDEAEKANVKSFFLEQVENLSIKESPFDSDSIQGGLYAFYNQLF